MCPEGVDPEVWDRYMIGTRSFDALYATGARCPSNPDPDAAKCLCAVPKEKICKYWWALGGLASKIGGAIKTTFEGIK
jgi:hypothetical protein